MVLSLRALADLLRLHFFFAWPLLFASGLALGIMNWDGFSLDLVLSAVLIGFFGFEAGLVLNDYVDRRYDRREVESGLTRYWRPFGTRPLVTGKLDESQVIAVFLLLVAVTAALALSLPYPHSVYVLAIMAYCYTAELFYQLAKRSQRFPVAQLVGRTDFALFPVAGYLCAGYPDETALLYFVFFYLFAEAHLGVNDLADLTNDLARRMQSVTVLFGKPGTAYWVAGFVFLHLGASIFFLSRLGPAGIVTLAAGAAILLVASARLLSDPSPAMALRVLPFFHATMVVYAAGIIVAVVW